MLLEAGLLHCLHFARPFDLDAQRHGGIGAAKSGCSSAGQPDGNSVDGKSTSTIIMMDKDDRPIARTHNLTKC